MKRTYLARMLKGIEVFLAAVGLVIYAGVIPAIINEMADMFPEYAYLAAPCIAAISLSAIPIIVAMVSLWGICGNIARDESFSKKTVKYLSVIGYCALADTLYVFLFMIFIFLQKAVNPGVLILVAAVILLGTAVAVIAFLLVYLVDKASGMEDEIMYTV